ncbi:MAG TPA: DUF418 domain-containing protein [Allosphingosinicella sp.]|jgi:uncharacterized protein|nr:DUF418 domain-containing protein [Allosphingosinicella sp.]
MTAATQTGRIAQLDIIRGVAVMGILAMNIVAFAMPFQAYMNPLAYGMESGADLASWAFSFVFIDGKMRGLFSFLFGASMLLVTERAEAAGQSPASVHFSRMAWLLLFGLLHFYFIWFGDILSGYAMMGIVAYFFRGLSARRLVLLGGLLVVAQLLVYLGLAVSVAYLAQVIARPAPSVDSLRQWQELQDQFGILSGEPLRQKLALFRGPWSGVVHDRLEGAAEPFTSLFYFGWETLGYMLFGMAALKTGFFRGKWRPLDYFKVAVVGLAVTVPAYALLAWIVASNGFSMPMILTIVLAATVPFRPLMVMAYAALIILLASRRGPLVERIGAAGRAAFTNYLGTSILMTSLFYGYGAGLYGTMSRIELWLVVFAMWALMLAWSKPWLDRFRYGPFEWLWRSLARGRIEPMRRRTAAA